MKRFVYVMTALSITAVAYAEYPLDIPDGSDWNIAEMIYPSLHINITAGDSSEDPSELAVGGHDPNDNFVVQGIEPSVSLRLNDHIEGFATLNLSYGANEEWVDEWEEYFGKLTALPGGLEVRGGRMLNRFGIQNAKHLHSWSAVDMPLVNGYFLGEEGLAHEGGEVTWYMPTPFVSALSVSYGEALAHDHDHGHGEEGHGEEEEEHGHEENLAEEAAFQDDLLTLNALMQFRRDDFNQVQFGASFATGDNGLGSDTDIFGLNGSYVWRENGFEPGGRSLTWNNELFFRDIGGGEGHGHEDEHGHEEEHEGEEEHHDEDGHHEEDEEHHAEEEEGTPDEEEFGFYSELIYGANDLLDLALRVGFVEGIDSLGSPERFRVSPWVTIYLSQNKNVKLKLQYNYDDLEDEEAHSFWAQLQTSFGGKEVR